MTTHKEKGIKISPKFYRKDWTELDLNGNNIVNWRKAIEIFKDRIEGRYFKQIQVLDSNPDREIGLYSGFAIMSLTCLLMETLEQFWNGNVQTSRKSLTSSHGIGLAKFCKLKKAEISNDAISFYSFFQRSEKFKLFFDTHEKANVFYSKIRCGLLHQGQTKGKSLIHIRKDEPMLNWINYPNFQDGISIQRRLFLDEIRIVYEKYVNKLENEHDLNFRKQTLLKKMNYIVDQK
jgi:hypothetical protein